MKKSRENHLKCAVNESTLSTAGAVPPPSPMGKAAKREYRFPPVSSFRAKREIFLAQRPNGERQMRSSRSTHAILSLPHKYRIPLRRKRSLGYARDDDMRERVISHSLSFLHVEGCPCGADLSSAFGAPLLQGATQQSCKNADPSQGLLPPYRHFERSEKSSLHTGKRDCGMARSKSSRGHENK